MLDAKWQPLNIIKYKVKRLGDVFFFFIPTTMYFKLWCIHWIVLPYIDLRIYCIMYLLSVLNPCVFVYFLKSTDQNTVGLLHFVSVLWHLVNPCESWCVLCLCFHMSCSLKVFYWNYFKLWHLQLPPFANTQNFNIPESPFLVSFLFHMVCHNAILCGLKMGRWC